MSARDLTSLALGVAVACGVLLLASPPVAQALARGIRLGLLISLAAVGLSLIFSATGLANFAHGELLALGGILAFFLNTGAVGPQLHLVPAAVLAVVIAAMVAAGLEKGLWRPLRVRGAGLVRLHAIVLALALLLQNLVGFLWYFLVPGGVLRPYRNYAVQTPLQLGPVHVTPRDLTLAVLCLVVLAGVVLVLTHTRIGKATRAVADNRDLASTSGIDERRVILAAWVLGGGLAALAGVFFGISQGVGTVMGFRLLVLMFAGAVLGGLGSVHGAFWGSVVVGVATEVSTLWLASDLDLLAPLSIVGVGLLIRSHGSLRMGEQVG